VHEVEAAAVNRVPGIPAHMAGDGSHRTRLHPGHRAV